MIYLSIDNEQKFFGIEGLTASGYDCIIDLELYVEEGYVEDGYVEP